MCLGNGQAFSEQSQWCFKHPRALQSAVWLDLGVQHKWWVVTSWADVERSAMNLGCFNGGGVGKRKEGGPDSTVKPKLVCPKWWVSTSAGFCSDSNRSQGVWAQVQC